MDSWFVYLVECADGTFYTGVTTDLVRRIRQHNGELSVVLSDATHQVGRDTGVERTIGALNQIHKP